MANGDQSRKKTASYNTLGGLVNFENLYKNKRLNTSLNILETDLINETRADQFNFQNDLANFRTEEDIRRYEHSKDIYGLGQKAINQEAKYQKQQIYKDADARMQELGYAQDDLDFSFAETQIKNNFARANNKLAANDNKLNLRINSQDTLANLEQTKQRGRQFGTDMKDMSAKQTEEKADARRKLLKSTLETQANAGKALASGRQGQSARMLTQSIESVAAIDHYALHTQLERGDDSFSNIAQGTTNKKKSEDTQAGIQRKQLGFQRDKLKNNQKKLKNEQKEMAQLFGLTVEQYTADTEKLGRMMLDTYSNIGAELDRLDKDVFQERVNLYAKMPLPPRTAPRALPPRELQYDPLILPSDPIRFDPNMIGAAQQPKQPSTAAKILGGVSMVAGAVGTVLAPGNPATAAMFMGGSKLAGGFAESGLF